MDKDNSQVPPGLGISTDRRSFVVWMGNVSMYALLSSIAASCAPPEPQPPQSTPPDAVPVIPIAPEFVPQEPWHFLVKEGIDEISDSFIKSIYQKTAVRYLNHNKETVHAFGRAQILVLPVLYTPLFGNTTHEMRATLSLLDNRLDNVTYCIVSDDSSYKLVVLYDGLEYPNFPRVECVYDSGTKLASVLAPEITITSYLTQEDSASKLVEKVMLLKELGSIAVADFWLTALAADLDTQNINYHLPCVSPSGETSRVESISQTFINLFNQDEYSIRAMVDIAGYMLAARALQGSTVPKELQPFFGGDITKFQGLSRNMTENAFMQSMLKWIINPTNQATVSSIYYTGVLHYR